MSSMVRFWGGISRGLESFVETFKRYPSCVVEDGEEISQASLGAFACTVRVEQFGFKFFDAFEELGAGGGHMRS